MNSDPTSNPPEKPDKTAQIDSADPPGDSSSLADGDTIAQNEESGLGETIDVPGAVESAAKPAPVPKPLRWFDALIFAVLVAISVIGFYQHAIGDLYSDEADYALASVRGFEANRWDRSDIPREPNRLVAARHYHAPLTVYLIAVAHRFGAGDRTIRMPFIVAGGLGVGVVYLCGLALFDRRREIAVACALLVAVSPAIVRMDSHALPWSPILLELLLLLWCMAEFTRDRRWGWIAALIAAVALLFITSEMFFVAVPAVLAALPFLLWPVLRNAEQKRGVLMGAAAGAALFAVVVFVFWPSGAAGESVKMLRHYMQMRHSESFPVNVGNQIFTVAPRWSYLYWYWNDYKPFFVCYALGIPGLVGLAAARKLHTSSAPLVSMTALLLFAAHRAHIIGPEYLAHCLPFLTLLGGMAVYGMSLAWRPFAFVLPLILAIPVARWSSRVPLPGMDARAQISRWPAAARFLGARWQAGDKIMVGSQPVSVARWYLVYQGGLPSLDSQFQTMPIHAPKPVFLDRLASGFYRYVGVSNMFEDRVDLDEKTARILSHWPVAWRSDERGTGPSRLTLYQAPERRPASPLPTVNRP